MSFAIAGTVLTNTATATVKTATSSDDNKTNLGLVNVWEAAFNQDSTIKVNMLWFYGGLNADDTKFLKKDVYDAVFTLTTPASTDVLYPSGGSDSLATYTKAGPVTTGISAATPTVELFNPTSPASDATAFAINIKFSNTVADKTKTTSVENGVCLTVRTDAPKQYLCAVTKSVTTANQANLTTTHYLYNLFKAPATADITTTASNALTTSYDALTASGIKVYQATGAQVAGGSNAVINKAKTVQPNRLAIWPQTGNYAVDKGTTIASAMQISGEPLLSSNAKADTTAIFTAMKAGMATSIVGISASIAGATVTNAAASTALAAPVTATPAAATCPATGALSTVVAAGAAIAALAMAF